VDQTLAEAASVLSRALAPFARALEGGDDLILEYFQGLGWTLPQVPPALTDLQAGSAELAGALARLEDRLRRVPDGGASADAIDDAAGELALSFALFASAVRNLPAGLRDQLPPAFIAATHIDEHVQLRLFDDALARLIEYEFREIDVLARLLGLVESVPHAADPAIFQPAFTERLIRWDRLLLLGGGPTALARDVYGWGTPALDAAKLLLALRDLSFVFLAPAFFDYATSGVQHAIVPGLPDNARGERGLVLPMNTGTPLELALGLYPVPKLQPDEVQGLMIALSGLAGIAETFEIAPALHLTVQSQLDLAAGVALAFWPDRPARIAGNLLNDATPIEAGRATIGLRYAPASQDARLALLSFTGFRLDAAALSVEAGLGVTAESDADASVEIGLPGLRLEVGNLQGDSFLAGVLPDRAALNFDIYLGWSLAQGLYWKGSSGGEINIAVKKTAGPATLDQLSLAFKATDGTYRLAAVVSATTQLGPVSLHIEGVGVAALLDTRGGNLGLIDVGSVTVPPNGVGLSVDGGGFSGGGFLRYIAADQHYEGMLELEYEDRITLKAIGLLTTRLPGGRPGFSLLIIITAEFNPIQLGLGFTLNGVGGLLGLNRSADAERLRSGLRDNTLSSVLFPQNLVENAGRILSDLNQLFPAQPGRFIFGPVARLGWGTPTLITIDLGLLVEIPDPVRVLILGVLRARLPDENARLLQLQVNFLGVIDVQARRLAFDASLFDSKLLAFTLAGDMAVRLAWGDEPNFLLTVGGFHPAYQPPPLNLPTLRRLSLQLTSGDNPRLTLETYFAVTANTRQFGARAELLARAGSFSVYGFLSFDVLFQFNPFYFIAAISAKLALRAGGSEIASISLDFTLEGPTPWHVKGTARLKICWFLTIKVRFDKTFGESLTIVLPDIAVRPLLRAALADPANWEAQPAGSRPLLVTFRTLPRTAGRLVVAPAGVLTIQQRVAPLGIAIQRFGSQRPADGDLFAIETVTAGEGSEIETLDTSPVSEQFAPAEFFELTDAQKLAGKSFERYPSGVKLTDSEAFTGEYAVGRNVAYELFYIDEQRDLVPRGEPLPPDVLTFQAWAVRGAVAASPLSQARNGKSALAPGAVQVGQEAYTVVRASDLRPAAAAAQAASEAGAHRLLAELLRDNPALDGEVLVVPAFEVNRA
jgi:hypothetical protein